MITLKQKEYEKQRKKGQKTQEGYVYTYPKDKQKIAKVIEPKFLEPEYLKIKKHTIRRLLENYDYMQELRIALPQEGIAINGEQRGYLAQNIKGIELSCALSSKDIPIEDKIDWLKQIGSILREMDAIRQKYPHLSNFYYNDIHERNFIVNQSGIVYGVDPDSCSIQDNIPIQGLYSLYLSDKFTLHGFNKYHTCNPISSSASKIIPGKNSDIYCYIRMILNFMTGKQLYNFNPQMLHNYLNYLESKGANLGLLYCLASIHNDNTDNLNPDYLLDYIKEILQYSNVKYDETGELTKILKR